MNHRPAMSRRRRAVPSAAGMLLVAAMVGCGSDDSADDTANATTTTIATVTTVTTAATDAGDATATTAVSSDAAPKVNANSASVDELAAAFDAAGVPNAERWAHEVEEYRPYSDDGWAHLRQELSKYNIDDATFAKIVATLEV